jgi:chromosome segregation ATPase
LTTKLDDISEAIGYLRAEVRMLGDQQKAANESRKAIYEKLEDMDDKIVAADAKIMAADAKIVSVDDRLESVEGPVAEFNKWRERGVGAVMLISFVAASVGGLLVTFGKKIWAVIVGT